jgi:hypothetical protein
MIPLLGSLETFDLPPLIRFIAQSRKTGRLRVVHGQTTGEIAFDGGLVVAATFGDALGLAALDAMARTMHAGTFTFFEGAVVGQRTIDLAAGVLESYLADLACPPPGPVLDGVQPVPASTALAPPVLDDRSLPAETIQPSRDTTAQLASLGEASPGRLPNKAPSNRMPRPTAERAVERVRPSPSEERLLASLQQGTGGGGRRFGLAQMWVTAVAVTVAAVITLLLLFFLLNRDNPIPELAPASGPGDAASPTGRMDGLELVARADVTFGIEQRGGRGKGFRVHNA